MIYGTCLGGPFLEHTCTLAQSARLDWVNGSSDGDLLIRVGKREKKRIGVGIVRNCLSNKCVN